MDKPEIQLYQAQYHSSQECRRAIDELERKYKYIDETEPWNLNKDESKRERLSTVLFNLLEAINVGANLLAPFMPETANKIFNELGVEPRNFEDIDNFGATGEFSVTNNPQILFNTKVDFN